MKCNIAPIVVKVSLGFYLFNLPIQAVLLRLITSFLMFFSASTYALVWNDLVHHLGWQAITTQLNEGWDDCSEDQVPAWCSDAFQYYQFDLYGEAHATAKGGIIRFLGVDAPNRMNEFVLNLRKDGLFLARVEFDDKHFDAVEQLGESPTQAHQQKVDRALIEFMHQHQQQKNRTLIWKRHQEYFDAQPQKLITLSSDGELITLSVEIRQ